MTAPRISPTSPRWQALVRLRDHPDITVKQYVRFAYPNASKDGSNSTHGPAAGMLSGLEAGGLVECQGIPPNVRYRLTDLGRQVLREGGEATP